MVEAGIGRNLAPRGNIFAAVAIALALATPAHGQLQPPGRPPPQIDMTTIALRTLVGRFRSPVTCTTRAGDQVEIEESIVFRHGPLIAGEPTLRATFFGLDSPDLARCYSVVDPRLVDRRGVVYLTFRSHGRPDTGVTDWRRETRDGEFSYTVLRGKLHVREIGTEQARANVIDFGGAASQMTVRVIAPLSDADRLLSRYRDGGDPSQSPARRFTFVIDGPDGYRFTNHFIEDTRRRLR